ncbi:MAG: DUF3108 domain-containing protein [Bacteroidota bacterium]
MILSHAFRLPLLLITLGAALVLKSQPSGAAALPAYPFDLGELLEYKLHYGWFKIGEASLELSDSVKRYEGKNCYELKVSGGTAGLLNIFASVDDEWGAVINQEDLTPVFTYRNIQEGKYQLEERVYISADSGNVRVESYRAHKDKRSTDYFEFDPGQEMYDMLSSILVMRNVDYARYEAGDTLNLDAFFQDTFYHFDVLYEGLDKVKTAVGKLKAYKLVPLMPENSVFNGKQSVKVWLSADSNRLPLKATANMFIGNASCEITSYKNIKYGPDYRSK